MVKEELPIAPEISQFFVVRMRLVPFGLSLGQSHGLGCLTGNADVIKMDGMVEFVLQRNDYHGVSWDSFIHRDVDAQKKADDQKTDQYNGSDFTLLRPSHRSV
jgi:hypothetical protein